MNLRAQLICAWMGLVATFFVIFAIWPFMGFLPPLSPSASAAETAAFYRSNATGIIVGAILLQLANMMYMPFFSAIALQISRIEGPSRLWTYSLLTLAALGFTPFLIGGMIFAAGAFRPDRPDEIVTAISDIGFLLMIGGALPAPAQMLTVAVPILASRDPRPALPRWYAYLSIWTALLALPGCLVALFHGGPFAWNGLLSFWIAAGAFCGWCVVTFYVLREALLRELSE